MHPGLLRGTDNLCVGCVQPSIPHVVHHIRVEQWCVLWDDPDRFPNAFEDEIFNWLSVNEDSTGGGSVKSIEESEDSGLATSRRTDDGHFLPGRDGEGDPFEDASIRMISKVNLVKSDGAALQD